MQKMILFALLVGVVALAACGVEPEGEQIEQTEQQELLLVGGAPVVPSAPPAPSPDVSESWFWKCDQLPRNFYIRREQCEDACPTSCRLVLQCVQNGRPVICP